MLNDIQLLKSGTATAETARIFSKSIQFLKTVTFNTSCQNALDELILLAQKNLTSLEQNGIFQKNEICTYAEKFEAFLCIEYLKYRICLVGNEHACNAVVNILDFHKVHLGQIITSSELVEVNFNEFDFVVICSAMPDNFIQLIDPTKIVRFDFLRCLAWTISPESAYLEQDFRKRMKEKVTGVVTGLSYQQRGINWDKLQKNLICLAAPSQDLFVDYNSVLWAYDELIRNNGKMEYCIIGMDFYRLWYDMSLSEETRMHILPHYHRIKCTHHFHQTDAWLINYMHDLKICDLLMVPNYMDRDYTNTFHPEKVEWRRTTCYDPGVQYEKDCEEVKKVFNKPYPQTFSENVEILNLYLKFCHLHGIKVLVYIPPFPAVFNENTPCKMREKTLNVLMNLKQLYAFDILDLSDSPLFSNKHFADWCHLNGDGADVATVLLNDYMQKIWI